VANAQPVAAIVEGTGNPPFLQDDGTITLQYCPAFILEEAFMHLLAEGQFVRHASYGLGVVTQSDSERTSIDFHLHGPKKFATSLMTVELTDEAPPPKPRPPKRQRVSTRVPRVTLSADAK